MTLFGQQIPDVVSVRQRIGVMPEFAGFYDWMSAKDYLVWYAGFYGGMRTRPEILLSRVGLADVGSNPVKQFSRGMKQRLALARALLHGPELLILDEPTNGLDPRGRREIHDLLLELAEKDGVGILLCTHLLDDVERLCTRISIIDRGKTVLENDLDCLLQGAGTPRYCLHMTQVPDGHPLPPMVRLLNRDESWWSLEIDLSKNIAIGKVWQDLLLYGWSFDEIHAERSDLESLYLELTGADVQSTQLQSKQEKDI
jgi:ABC-2 type transport system ATP-binding protein